MEVPQPRKENGRQQDKSSSDRAEFCCGEEPRPIYISPERLSPEPESVETPIPEKIVSADGTPTTAPSPVRARRDPKIKFVMALAPEASQQRTKDTDGMMLLGKPVSYYTDAIDKIAEMQTSMAITKVMLERSQKTLDKLSRTGRTAEAMLASGNEDTTPWKLYSSLEAEQSTDGYKPDGKALKEIIELNSVTGMSSTSDFKAMRSVIEHNQSLNRKEIQEWACRENPIEDIEGFGKESHQDIDGSALGRSHKSPLISKPEVEPSQQVSAPLTLGWNPDCDLRGLISLPQRHANGERPDPIMTNNDRETKGKKPKIKVRETTAETPRAPMTVRSRVMQMEVDVGPDGKVIDFEAARKMATQLLDELTKGSDSDNALQANDQGPETET